jgi:hypothetical protein
MIKQRAVPDYKRLNRTPGVNSKRKLNEQARFGSGRKTIRLVGHRPSIPFLRSQVGTFPSKATPTAPHYVKDGKPLSIPETPSNYPFAQARQVTPAQTIPRQLVNRSDKSIATRQLHRLQNKVASGEYSKQTQEELKKLLATSSVLGHEVLTHLQGQSSKRASSIEPPEKEISVSEPQRRKRRTTASSAKDIAPVKKEESSSSSEPKRTSSRAKASSREKAELDLATLNDDYPTMSKEAQKDTLNTLRQQYDATKMANVNTIKKAIRTKLE